MPGLESVNNNPRRQAGANANRPRNEHLLRLISGEVSKATKHLVLWADQTLGGHVVSGGLPDWPNLGWVAVVSISSSQMGMALVELGGAPTARKTGGPFLRAGKPGTSNFFKRTRNPVKRRP